MVIENLKSQTQPITVAECARILGMATTTLEAVIEAKTFHQSSIIRIGKHIRIDPHVLAAAMEEPGGLDYAPRPWRWEINGNGITCTDARTGITRYDWGFSAWPASKLPEFLRHLSEKSWVTKRDMVDIVAIWFRREGAK